MTRFRCLTCLLIFVLSVVSCWVQAQVARDGEKQSFFLMPTGNGHGFALFDSQHAKMLAFLDHPYRYVRAPQDIHLDGPERRNLLEQFSLGFGDHPIEDWLQTKSEYLEQTNIIHSVSGWQDQTAERYFFAPFGLEQNSLVALLHVKNHDPAAAEALQAFAQLKFHLGANPVSPDFWDSTLEIVKIPGEDLKKEKTAWVLRGHGAGVLAYIPFNAQSVGNCEIVLPTPLRATLTSMMSRENHCSATELGLRIRSPLDKQNWFGLMVLYIEDPAELRVRLQQAERWIHGRSPKRILRDSLREWREWRRSPPMELVRPGELQLWRQSEAVLRMAQVREPNQFPPKQLHTSHGMILASLSPGAWATGWVRDGAYATVALSRSGHLQEALASLNFFLNADPVGKFRSFVGGTDYRISVTRYFGSGEEEADFSNQASPNIETDGWGLVLWAARNYLDHSHDLSWLQSATRHGTVYEVLKKGVAEAIEAELERRPNGLLMKPDSSIWEVHQENARHFTYTSLSAARGLCDFASIARRSGHGADARHFAELSRELEGGILGGFVSPEGALLGAAERSSLTDLDSSVTEAYSFGLLPRLSTHIAEKTLIHLELLKNANGGFHRLGGTASYDTDEWAFVDFRMASSYLRMNQADKAQVLIDSLVRRAAINNNLIPEMLNAQTSVGPLGIYRGSIPMVGYGSGAFINTVLDRDGFLTDVRCTETGP